MLEFVLYAELEVRFIVTSLICHAMKLAVDMDFIQQCVGMLNTKSILPFVKIFSFSCQLQPEYGKYLTQINFTEVVMNLMKGK